MSVSGSLATMPLPDLLQWLGGTARSGTLELERRKVVKRIVFREGRITACSSDDPPERLGHYLVSQGRITEDHLRSALATQAESGRPLGALLIDAGAIDPEQLGRDLAAKAEETIFSLFEWEDGEFRYLPDSFPRDHWLPLGLRVEEVLLRGAKRTDEARRIRAVFPDNGIVLARTAKMPPSAVLQNKMARAIYESIDGQRTIAELLLHAHASEFLVHKFLFELFRNGLVTIREVRKIEDAPTPEPPAPPEPPPPAVALPPPAASATAVAEAPPAPPPAAVSDLAGVLEAARSFTASGQLEAALDLLNAAYAAHPGDDALRKLVAEAEAAFVEKAYRHYLPPARIPVLLKPVESLTGEALRPLEVFLLSRIDGSWNVRSIIQITPIREVDALRTLKRMRERGVIDLREPA